MDLTVKALVAVVAGSLGAAAVALLLIQWRTHKARQIAALWPGAMTADPPWQRVVSLVSAAALLGAAAFWPAPPPIGPDRAQAAVVFAVDVSRSMEAADVAPTRLDAAVTLMTALARSLNGPVAITAFAGESTALAPFTTDRGALALALQEVRAAAPRLLGGSAPAIAIGAGLDLLAESGRYGAVVLATDGEWTDDTGLDAALTRAATAGVPVHVLGFGTADGIVMPSVRPEAAAPADSPLPTRVTRLDVNALNAIANQTGGRSFTVDGAQLPADVVALLQTPPPAPSVPGEWLRRLFWIAAFILLLAGSGSPLKGGAITPAVPRARPVPLVLTLFAAVTAMSCADRGSALRAGNQALDRGDMVAAQSRYADSVARGELADRAWFNSGVAHHRSGAPADALDSFARAASIATADDVRAFAHFNRGYVLAEEGQLDAAETAFIDALRAEPGFEAARVNLAIVRERLRTPDNAPPPPPQVPPPRYTFPRDEPPRKPRVQSDW